MVNLFNVISVFAISIIVVSKPSFAMEKDFNNEEQQRCVSALTQRIEEFHTNVREVKKEYKTIKKRNLSNLKREATRSSYSKKTNGLCKRMIGKASKILSSIKVYKSLMADNHMITEADMKLLTRAIQKLFNSSAKNQKTLNMDNSSTNASS